ncbi:MAG TPA: hypothetical protein VJ647_00740, partial [Chitinophagaceae bacterium]|nr:hypothetical protein [Chitinophagaceae bacterium]
GFAFVPSSFYHAKKKPVILLLVYRALEPGRSLRLTLFFSMLRKFIYGGMLYRLMMFLSLAIDMAL